MDASSAAPPAAAPWSWPRSIISPYPKRHTTADRFTPTTATTPPTTTATAMVVNTKIRKATGPPPFEKMLFPPLSEKMVFKKRMLCRRTNNSSANSGVAVCVAATASDYNYSSTTFQRSSAPHRAATATSARGLETFPNNRTATATMRETLPIVAATTTAAMLRQTTAASASAMETFFDGRIATTATTTTATATVSMETLPVVILRQIGAFAGGCFPLGETCKTNLEITKELHYTINIMENASRFSAVQDPSGVLSNRHMGGGRGGVGGGGGGVKQSGGLTTGRAVTRITVTGCTDLKDTNGGYQILEEAVKRVVQRSIPTLRSITVKGRRGKDSPRVASILGDLASLAANRNRVAPNLVRVELNHGATAFSAAGKAIEAGLWPALEELIVPNCHAKLAHAKRLVSGLSSGRARNLRVLVWDEQASTQHEHLDNAILSALSAGRCPHIERLSFTNPKIRTNPSYTLLNTILACPELVELRLTRKSMSTQRVFYVTCRASRLQTFREKLAIARTKRLGV